MPSCNRRVRGEDTAFAHLCMIVSRFPGSQLLRRMAELPQQLKRKKRCMTLIEMKGSNGKT